MLRGLLILVLVGYAFYRVFRFFFGGSLSGPSRSYQQTSQKQQPNVKTRAARSDREQKNYKGGEYIDYEEVD